MPLVTQNAFGYVTSGKAGWGSSMLYRITGDKKYLKTALSQMEFILSSQHKDGFMLGPGAKKFGRSTNKKLLLIIQLISVLG